MALKNAGIIESATEDLKAIMQEEADSIWWNEHAEEVAQKNKGKFIAIINKQVFPGDSYEEAYQKAKEKYPELEPLVDHIPFKKEVWVL